MIHELIQKLTAQRVQVTDGAWGTQLQMKGLPSGACPDAWNLTEPDKVREVAAAYVEAGSDLILTNTFGASSFILERHGIEDQVVEINTAGVRLSKEAAQDRSLVFASIGPTGVMLMMGQVKPEELKDAFLVQATAMAEAGADGIVIETMSDPQEAALAVEAAKTTGLPVVACMVFDSGADKDRTMMGTTPEEAATILTEAGADVIGSNCGQGIAGFVPICQRLSAATDRPIWIKGNAGLPEMVDGQSVYRQTAEEFAGFIPALVEAGASFIGGCCGTSPEFIAVVKKTILSL
jgi:5-methyltetrahydrofolate--homocysteine methyltransferase